MRILAIDTATWTGAVGIVDGEVVLADRWQSGAPSHGYSLLPLIADALAEARCELRDLDAVAVSIGPGSFTGLRIGLSTAKGFALTWGLELVGVPTLAALAAVADVEEGLVCPVLDARKGEVYVALYRVGTGGVETLAAEQAVRLEAWLARIEGPCTFLGDAASAIPKRHPGWRILPFDSYHPRGSAVGRLAAQRLRDHGPDDLDELEPLYVRPPDVEMEASEKELVEQRGVSRSASIDTGALRR